ncbi:Conserved_hypothetical protein [Hexamita inflata]|uniref:Uncharacterized protein n=1 Tax=Hexamita inflata TaxID=28002 RepID=A0AA86UH51_9EUKA|nr:Conserved hypothetical protein [Hexamita inflata]
MSNIKVNTQLQLTGYEQLGELTKVFQYNVNKLKLFECYNISTPNATISTRTGNIFNLNAIPKSIIELFIEKCELDNIEGFQFMDQLQILVLANNKLQQIDQLKNLTKLTFLDLQRNQIKDILMLQSLISLVHLNLSQNRITDISVLQFLPQIVTLDISNNGLSDIQPIKFLVSMQDLNISGNMHILKPSYSSIILPNLRKINLRWNIIGDISVIQSFSSVIELNLSCNNLKQLLQPRFDLNNLIYLDLNGNGLQDISTLRYAVSLQYLDLSGNGKTTPMNIDGLQNLTKLIKLNLNSCKLKQILAVFKLRSLQELNLSENELTDISPLKQLTNLLSLNVQGNKITNLSAIENHPNFDKYLTSLQQKPSPKLLKFSAKMKNIHQIMEQQYQSFILNKSFKQNVVKQKEHVQQLVSSSINNQVWFTGKIIVLLKNFE